MSYDGNLYREISWVTMETPARHKISQADSRPLFRLQLRSNYSSSVLQPISPALGCFWVSQQELSSGIYPCTPFTQSTFAGDDWHLPPQILLTSQTEPEATPKMLLRAARVVFRCAPRRAGLIPAPRLTTSVRPLAALPLSRTFASTSRAFGSGTCKTFSSSIRVSTDLG